MQKYTLNFDGTIGDFIRLLRKSKKINSKELSTVIGKSDSYVSHLENGRNKNPDYATLFEIFKRIGVEKDKIEDYLEYFGFLSPEREAHEEAQMLARMYPTEEDFEHMRKEAEYYEDIEEQEVFDKEIEGRFNLKKENNNHATDNGSDLLEDILIENIKDIVKVLNNIMEHDLNNAYELINGLNVTLDNTTTNLSLYKFIVRLFSEKLVSLDDEGLLNVINKLYEELNRIDREKTAFGKPRQRKLITNLK